MSTATRSAARYTPMCGRARRCTGLESSGCRCETPSRCPPADLVKQHIHRSRAPFLGRTTARQRTRCPGGPFLGRTTVAVQRTHCPGGLFLDRTLFVCRHSRPQLRFPMLPLARSHCAFTSSAFGCRPALGRARACFSPTAIPRRNEGERDGANDPTRRGRHPDSTASRRDPVYQRSTLPIGRNGPLMTAAAIGTTSRLGPSSRPRHHVLSR
jgi:hypothetical protein